LRHLVCCGAVPDLANLSVSQGQGRVFEKGKRLLDPAGEKALEIALQAKQAGDEVIVLGLGREQDADVLKRALAMGADRAVFAAAPDDGFVLANAVLAAASQLGAERVYASDGEVAQRLASMRAGVRIAPLETAARSPNAIAIMKAAKKAVERIEIALPGDDATPRLEIRGEYLA
jgi:electron transfer flavoprotein alpha/beta subunit